MGHVSAEHLGLFLGGQLEPTAAETLEEHLDICEACRHLASETVRQRRAQEDAFAATALRERPVRLPVELGHIVDGRFRVERLIGVGGMGCVFEAHHVQLNHRVALKFMLGELLGDSAAVDRFTREARAAVRLVTPHVGRILDLGKLTDGQPYLVMEYLQGETVEQRLQREGRFAREVAVMFVLEALSALEEAHAQGIIHRDLKPANLFIARKSNGSEIIKVLDFGIAKSIHPEIEAGLGATSQRMLIGSPLFMAPEQLTGGPVDPRIDLWALGCTLYQMLTGTPPFGGADLVELMYTIRTRPHLPLADTALGPVIDACLQKDPTRRVASAERLRSLLDASVRRPPAARSRRRVVAAAGLAALTLGAAFAFWPMRAASPPLVMVAPPPIREPSAPESSSSTVSPEAPRESLPVERHIRTVEPRPRPQPPPARDPLDDRL